MLVNVHNKLIRYAFSERRFVFTFPHKQMHRRPSRIPYESVFPAGSFVRLLSVVVDSALFEVCGESHAPDFHFDSVYNPAQYRAVVISAYILAFSLVIAM